MGIGVSIFLLAVGAILAFATSADVSGLDLNTVGFILMIAGAVGLVMFLVVFGPRSRRAQVVDDDASGRTRRTVVEE
jgi:hypothetical protein